MMRAAVASIRSRPTVFVAGFVSMFLGTVVVGSFASLLATGLDGGTSAIDQEKLVTMASVVGGWGLVIVLFSVASTMSVSVRQRTTEIGLYRALGEERDDAQPQRCDACFTGAYPTTLTDLNERQDAPPLKVVASR